MKRLLILTCLLVCSCHEMHNPIPDYPVYLVLDLTFEDKALRDIPSSKAYTVQTVNSGVERVGFGGVLVVHAVDDRFYAFDLACPHEQSRNIHIAADENTLNAVCTVCGTRYDIGVGGTGAPNGVGKSYLKRYAVIDTRPRIVVNN